MKGTGFMKKDWLTVEDIEKEFKIRDFELYPAVRREDGIPAYEKHDLTRTIWGCIYRVRFSKLEAQEAEEEVIEKVKDGTWEIWSKFLPPFFDLHDLVFKREDIEAHFKADEETGGAGTERHKEDREAKERCIKAARNLRLKHPEMTIADACFNDMVCNEAIKTDGSLYTEKTIRKWINTLWTDKERKPGRRPKTA
jgi:hypothetical protein